nr:ferredoxin--NADP reductase [Saprospiraceae bacterium]
MAEQHFFKLKVNDIEENTREAATVILEVPESLSEPFKYRAGQYITVKLFMDGKELRRSYSISSTPDEEDFHFTVKKVKGGKVSPYLVQQLKKGELLEVSAPEGKFTMDFSPDKKRAHYFFAAGSGITPVISLIKDALNREPKSEIFLLYGNKSEDQVIFKEELERLSLRYQGQFFYEKTFSGKKKGSLSRLFSSGGTPKNSLKGRIDGKLVDVFLEKHPSRRTEQHFFICGPGDMLRKVSEHLKSKGIVPDCIHLEYFTVDDSGKKVITGSQDTLAIIKLNGETIEMTIPKDKNILETLQDAGYDPPYSCTSGVCSSCMAKLTKGKVEMETCLALDDSEVEDGYILTCQSKSISPEIELTYEV